MDLLISVVMPSLNQRRFLPEAVESVLGQQGVQVELIVADGGSTDGTLDWLAMRAAKDTRLRWSSGPDSGPAQAINRALRQARGTLIGWLNADDVYTAGALQRAAAAMATHPNWIMLYGHGKHVDEHGAVLSDYPSRLPDTPIGAFSSGCFICQPTVLLRRTFLLLNGVLDETLRTAYDFDWWLRAFGRSAGRIGFVDAVQALSRLHADSITLRQRYHIAREGMLLLHRHLGGAPCHWIKNWVTEALASGQLANRSDVQVLTLVDEARDWLTPGELGEILQWIESDCPSTSLPPAKPIR